MQRVLGSLEPREEGELTMISEALPCTVLRAQGR